jgi:FdhE protein
MPLESTEAADPIIQRLRALARKSPDLKDAARVYEAVLPLLRDAEIRVGTIPLTQEQAREKMEKGQPLLFGTDLDLDLDSMRALMLKLARALESLAGENEPRRAVALSRILLALEENTLDLGALLVPVAEGKSGPLASCALRLGLDAELLMMLLQNALKPAMREWRRQLAPLTEGTPWSKGACLICGDAATLAELQGNNLTMHLRCGRCGADWLFRRLQCVYCGNEDPRTLRYLDSGSRGEIMRAETCEKCKGYIKIIAAFDPTPAELLAVEDLAALHLDYIAQKRGYSRRIIL